MWFKNISGAEQRICSVFISCLVFTLASLNAQEKAPFTSMDVFELEWVESPQISPDGSCIVYRRRGMDMMKDRRSSSLWIVNSDGSEHEKLTNREETESAAAWAPDSKKLAFTSSKGEGGEIYTYSTKRGRVTRLTQLIRSPSGLSWSPDGKFIAFSMLVPEAEPSLVKPLKQPKGAKWATHPKVITRVKHEADGSGYTEPGYSHFFVVSCEGGTPRQITTGNFHHRGTPKWSPDNKYLYFSGNRNEDWEYDYRESEIYRVEVASKEIKKLTQRNGPDRGLALSPDGSQIAYLGYDNKVQTYQTTKLYVMNADGSDPKQVETNLDRSISDLHWRSDGSGVYAQYENHGVGRVASIDLSGRVKDLITDLGGEAVARPYSGGSYSVSSEGHMAYSQATAYHPAKVALLSNQSVQPTELVDLNRDLLPFRTLGEVEEIWWKSSVDDRDIQGWIVKPPSFDPSKTYPLLIENHGGPVSAYGPYFSPEIQLYATDGFVVLYPNPRGSTSYGEEFGNLLYHNYPGDDYHDVMDGVDAVLELGYTSEDSLFVTGGSAGGIMSAWMIGKNDRFRSAAVIKPVMNWISKTLVADNYFGYAYNRYPGQPWENPEDYWKFSPLSLVGNIKTPTLVMVGTSDLRTPLSESKQLYHALKLRKVETALVEMPGAYHFIANRPSQLIMKIEHILAWFRKSRK